MIGRKYLKHSHVLVWRITSQSMGTDYERPVSGGPEALEFHER